MRSRIDSLMGFLISSLMSSIMAHSETNLKAHLWPQLQANLQDPLWLTRRLGFRQVSVVSLLAHS